MLFDLNVSVEFVESVVFCFFSILFHETVAAKDKLENSVEY